MTVRDVLLSAHQIAGLDPTINGIQTGAHLRYLTGST
jgi:hypothetical protein